MTFGGKSKKAILSAVFFTVTAVTVGYLAMGALAAFIFTFDLEKANI